ncbi:MAG: DUF2892 domain-containing protein [Leptospiraceae bacterium]|nr:DUF2892 domain-containing protein [Leptospiraceae bacterium]MDW7975133.1 DUF2892 domain-containing protein [Leptospiraceae bacterium]
MLERHIDSFDRIAKILIGLFLIYWIGFRYESWWGMVGFIPILRGIFPKYTCWDYFITGSCELPKSNWETPSHPQKNSSSKT